MSTTRSPLGIREQELAQAPAGRRLARGRRHGGGVRSAVTGLIVTAEAALLVAASAGAASPPVGPLPAGPTATIATQQGELVAVALPRRASGRVWRIARRIDSRVLRQVSEADVGANVVLVFRAVGAGTATVAFGLTRGETSKAFESRRYTVRVSS